MSNRPWNDQPPEALPTAYFPPSSYYDSDDSTNYFGLSKNSPFRRQSRQAIFRFKIDNVLKIVREYSPTFIVYSMPWRLMAVLHENVRTDLDGEITIDRKFGLFLHCYGVMANVNWATYARVNMDIRNQIPGRGPLRRRFTHFFYKDQPNFGFYSLLNYQELTDESLGFVKDGAMVVEAVIYAEKPFIIPNPPIERPFTINGFEIPKVLSHLYSLKDH